MNPTASGRGILAACLAAVLMSVAGACGTDTEDPRPDPTPPYDEMPQNLCNRLRSEDLFRRFGLTLAPALDHHTTYSVVRTHWSADCTFVAHATDGRFTTKPGGFEPVGGIQVRVYDDVPGAVEAYNQDAARYVDLWRTPHPAPPPPTSPSGGKTAAYHSKPSKTWTRTAPPAAASEPPRSTSLTSSATRTWS
ncbi:hypothetical protein EDC02_7830 [Micromonospora sp. Llam0]|nr:hypothetical protein EDC02_7830 [Micromonospora sp. Llam0]